MPTKISERAFNPMRTYDGNGLLQEIVLMEMLFYAMNESII